MSLIQLDHVIDTLEIINKLEIWNLRTAGSSQKFKSYYDILYIMIFFTYYIYYHVLSNSQTRSFRLCEFVVYTFM